MKKLVPCLFALLLLVGCAARSPFKVGDTLVSAKDGTVLGKVIELGDHSFENGASGPSVHVELLSGKDAWYSTDTTVGAYVVKP
jgi:hypothetical protein